MPTSATGRTSNTAGFTLLKVLVVLVIVAVVAGILLLNYGRSDRDRLEAEASRLATLLNLALDEAIVRSSDIGLVINEQDYQFVVFEPRERRWRVLTERPFTPYAFDPSITLDVALPEEGMSGETLAAIKARRQRETTLRPQLLLFPGGEMTPFELTLALAELSATVSSDGTGPVRWSLAP